MYVKTQWVNNTTPINDTNLNKIEQGIYDNSLVVDAVTNTLNPTDTETYKTAELTEGQITDVIGVNDIIIKGQTSQDGTPTPSAPVDVNVVSGSNVINTSNKSGNLFNYDKWLENKTNFDTSDFKITKDCIVSIVPTRNDTDTLTPPMPTNPTASDIKTLQWMSFPVESNTDYTIILKNENLCTMQIVRFFYRENYSYINVVQSNFSSQYAVYTFKTTADTKFVSFRFDNESYSTGAKSLKISEIQLLKGIYTISNIPNYESYQGKELPLDLGNIELCKIGDYQDYFYKSGSKWYLHKEIGSFILNGNVSFQKHSSSNSYFTAISRFTNNVPVYPETNNIVAPIICTHFDATYINDIAFNSVQKIGFSFINSKEVWFGLPTSIATNASEVQNWLNNQINNENPVVVHHALATPTDTEITNTTLISQLETIYNAPLYEQTYITQTNNDLPMVLDITACKDNINGIKAFIRK